MSSEPELEDLLKHIHSLIHYQQDKILKKICEDKGWDYQTMSKQNNKNSSSSTNSDNQKQGRGRPRKEKKRLEVKFKSTNNNDYQVSDKSECEGRYLDLLLGS